MEQQAKMELEDMYGSDTIQRGFCFITFFAMVKYKQILVRREKLWRIISMQYAKESRALWKMRAIPM